MAPAVARADGTVALYLQPLPADAGSLSFAFASISAVAAGGAEHSLALRGKAIGPSDAGHQRLLASARLPAGSYAGFSFKLRQAGVKRDGREINLVVPETAVRLDSPFTVSGDHGGVYWLSLRYDASVVGTSFSPAFTLSVPPRPIADHAGFVSGAASNTITVFDRQSWQAVDVIDTCAGAAGMALDARRRRLYVACPSDDEIQAIDVNTHDILERTRVSPGDRPRELALAADGATLLSVNAGSSSVSFFDASSLTRKERLEVGSGPASLLFDTSGRRAFVFNARGNSISVIDVASGSLAATISTDAAPLRGQLNARGDRLYVIHDRSPYMTVVDARQLTTITRARLRIGVSAIAVDRVRDLCASAAATIRRSISTTRTLSCPSTRCGSRAASRS